MRVALLERHERWQQAVEERVAATAEITYRDEQLDTLIASPDRELLVLANGDRNHPTYRKLMPTQPSLAMRSIGGDTQRQEFERNHNVKYEAAPPPNDLIEEPRLRLVKSDELDP